MQHSNTSSKFGDGNTAAGSGSLLKFAEMRKQLGISRSGLYKMLWERRIPYKKIGVEYRFDQAEINAWLDRRSVKARI